MAKLGFLGLGLMGYPMARNLLRAGHEVALWSNTAAKAHQLATEERGIACDTPRQVAENADVIFLCVGTTEMAREVILGTDGIIHGARRGTVVADASTISPSESRQIGKALAAEGVDFLDAPCTGSTPGATAGTLTFMIGGDQAVFEKTRPIFEVMGKRLYYCGGPGMGLQAKLTQNLILSNILMAFNEGMVLAAKGGIEPKLMLDILDNSAAKSGLISYKAPFVFRRDFTTNFSTKWMHKDVALALESGKELRVPLPLTSLTGQLFQAAIDNGHGEEDMCSTIKVLEESAGVVVKPE
ncbi:MAG TPA: NAD(P)-dependent oxidoreductase [Bryobacteraceae bacterium]|jgi:3-hydroxyisobutyrate dehydrogenase/2-hydroxy-3-oxopropionate reductase|nr:NAD(P)-dependent oxidoreductase [Bryobacteraceae bacterium]